MCGHNMTHVETGNVQTLIKGISSMATRQVLTQLAKQWQARSGVVLELESVGGVDAVKRVQAGEVLDVVLLASNAIDKLVVSGHVVAGTKVDVVLSSTAVAVREGAQLPDISTEEALKAAVLATPSIGYSTGPSGVALQALFARWGIAEQVCSRMLQARPGVPVASLVAQGEAALGFQQLSELMHVPGIAIVGNLPPAVAIDTVFSGALVAGSAHAQTVAQLLSFLQSPETASIKLAQGMSAV